MKKKIILFLSVLLLLFIGYILYFPLKQGYSWSEMDWNQDGHTTIIEFLQSSEIGKREYVVNGKVYIEYFSLKDGLPVKTVPKDK